MNNKELLNDICELAEKCLQCADAEELIIKIPKKLYDAVRKDLPKKLLEMDMEITDGDLFRIENKNSFYKDLELEEL